MCVFGPHSFEARDKAKGNRGRVGVRLVVSIRPAASFPVSPFLIGVIKKGIDYVQEKV